MLSASFSAAAPPQFGEPVPLTNLRYGKVAATMTLTSNGRELFGLWTESVTKFAKLGADPIIGHRVTAGGYPSVAWTGETFLVAAESRIRVLDAEGVPIGAERSALMPGTSFSRAATNGRNVLVVARSSSEVRAFVFDRQGVAADPAGKQIDDGYTNDVAVASNGSGYAAMRLRGPDDDVRFSLFDENGALRAQASAASEAPGSALIASNGNDYLGVWVSERRVQAVRIQQDGTVGTPFVLVALPAGSAAIIPASIVWTGDHYTVATYQWEAGRPQRVQLVDASPFGVIREPVTIDALSSSYPMLAMHRGHLLLSWSNANGSYVRDLSAAGPEIATNIRGANAQDGFRSVTGSDSTLVVWHEDRWRMGIRGRDGSWSERELADSTSKRLATDGHGFVIADVKNFPQTVSYYESGGAPRWSNVPVSLFIEDIVWNGREFILAGLESGSGRLKAARLSPAGVLSTPVDLLPNGFGAQLGHTRLATDGENILLTYSGPLCVIPCISNPMARAILFDGNLNRITGELELVRQYTERESLVWDGAQYVFVYTDIASGRPGGGIYVRGISRQGVPETKSLRLTDRMAQPSVTATPYGTAIAWIGEGDVDQLRLVSQNGEVESITPRDPGFGGFIAMLPDGRPGYLSDRLLDEEPYFGSPRLTLSVGDVAGAGRVPDTPKLTVSLAGNQTLRAQWTAPPQAVNGYRLEYKIGTQEWLELEAWFGPNERTATITPVGNPAGYSFRVRAWSDGGTSAYSAPASMPPTRRRAAR